MRVVGRGVLSVERGGGGRFRRGQSREEPHAAPLADAAYSALRERIRTCELLPGQRITEQGLVAETGLGKTPVREALGRLVNEQLVDVTPRSGYRVRELTLQDVDEIFELWGIVWPETVALASQRITQSELDVLRTISFREGAGIEGMTEMVRFVAAVARNDRLTSIATRAMAEIDRVFYLLERQGVSMQFPEIDEKIVPAFEARRLAEVQRYVREWIERSYAKTVEALRGTPAVRSAALVLPPRD